ncbi:MAG: STAS domain-containing protein [Acidimicrobiales bacterium]
MLSSEDSRTSRSAGVAPGDLQVVVSGHDAHYEVWLQGELDMSTAAQLRDELTRVATDGARHVTVDLRDLAFIDSTGLSVLITGLKRLRQNGGDMALRSPTPGTLRVLEITGLTGVFAIS